MRRLLPSRAGVVDEGNNRNKQSPRTDVFPLLTSFRGYTRDGNKPGMCPFPVRSSFARTRALEILTTKEH